MLKKMRLLLLLALLVGPSCARPTPLPKVTVYFRNEMPRPYFVHHRPGDSRPEVRLGRISGGRFVAAQSVLPESTTRLAFNVRFVDQPEHVFISRWVTPEELDAGCVVKIPTGLVCPDRPLEPSDLVSMLANLGLSARVTGDRATDECLGSISHTIAIDGERLAVYPFESPRRAVEAAMGIRGDGRRIESGRTPAPPPDEYQMSVCLFDFAEERPPHWYWLRNALLLYAGKDPRILSVLQELAGPPFIGLPD